MQVYNLLQYNDNYSMASESLWNCYRDELNDDANEHNTDKYRIDNSRRVTSEPFEYKTKIIGITKAKDNILYTEVVIPINY